MTSEYIEQRNGGYYVAGTRVPLDSVVYSFERGNSPEAIQKEYPLLTLPQIYGSIAFYLDHQEHVRSYLEAKEHHIEASSIPLAEANPELWSRLGSESLQPTFRPQSRQTSQVMEIPKCSNSRRGRAASWFHAIPARCPFTFPIDYDREA